METLARTWSRVAQPLPVTSSVVAQFLDLLARDNVVSGHASMKFQERMFGDGVTERLFRAKLGIMGNATQSLSVCIAGTRNSLGFGPPRARVGDAICSLRGANNSHALRQNGSRHEFVSECHLTGYPQHNGEQPVKLLHDDHQLDSPEEEFLI